MAELLLDTVFTLFGALDMGLPFLLLIGSTDASTTFGQGGVVSASSVDDV